MRREEKPEPVPPPNEWKMRNPWRPEHESAWQGEKGGCDDVNEYIHVLIIETERWIIIREEMKAGESVSSGSE